jgi:hypothetical protein
MGQISNGIRLPLTSLAPQYQAQVENALRAVGISLP